MSLDKSSTALDLGIAMSLGVSQSRQRLIIKVMAAHALAETCVNAMVLLARKTLYDKRGKLSFRNRVKLGIRDAEHRRWLMLLHKARNSCAHRSPDFPDMAVDKILADCETLVAGICQRYPTYAEPDCPRFDAAMNAFLMRLVAAAKVSPYRTLDGLDIPGRPNLAERISRVF